jgi:cytochrome c peroxidase
MVKGDPVNRSSLLVMAGAVLFAGGLAAAAGQAPESNPHLQVARGFLAFLDPNPAGLATNGRACADCHMPTDQFQLSPANVEARFQRLQQMRQDNPAADDALFRPIDANDFRVNGDAASDYTNLRENGLVRITFPLPPNVRLIDPLTNLPSDETFVDVWRSVPTINDVAITGPTAGNPWMREPNRFGGYQLDARVGTLQEQAVGALVNHAQVQSAPPQHLLDDVAAFQRAQFSNPRVRVLADAIAQGAAVLPDPDLPLDPLEQEGKAVFQRACAVCHGGPSETTSLGAVVRFHDIVSQCPRPVDPQGRFAFAACSPSLERNARTYEITVGTAKVRRTSSDPGRALLTGFVGGPAPRDDWNKFDVPSLRGIAHTAPYFHNNSAATLEDVVDHYFEFFKRVEAVFVPGTPLPLVATTDGIHFDRRPTLEERAALIAYLKRK